MFEKTDIHLHVPAGAVRKDEPSAGVTMAAALASLLTGRRVRDDVGMTGEITLRGQVLPVGGITGKIEAAIESGIKKVLIPKANAEDINLSKSNLKRVKILQVSNIREVLKHALAECKGKKELLKKIGS